MLNPNLAKRLAEKHSGFLREDIDHITDVILEAIATALERGARVELRGFGSFGVKQRRARSAWNPKTGEIVAVNGKRVPYFKTSKQMRELLNK